jgi:hypothetical protein
MKRRSTIPTLATLAAVAFIGIVSAAAPYPALAGGATQISGVGLFDEADECDSASVGADFALLMSGDLEGCLYTFIDTDQSSPSGTYRETATELFVASGSRRVRNDLPLRGEVRGRGEPLRRNLRALSTSHRGGQRNVQLRGRRRAAFLQGRRRIWNIPLQGPPTVLKAPSSPSGRGRLVFVRR